MHSRGSKRVAAYRSQRSLPQNPVYDRRTKPNRGQHCGADRHDEQQSRSLLPHLAAVEHVFVDAVVQRVLDGGAVPLVDHDRLVLDRQWAQNRSLLFGLLVPLPLDPPLLRFRHVAGRAALQTRNFYSFLLKILHRLGAHLGPRTFSVGVKLAAHSSPE